MKVGDLVRYPMYEFPSPKHQNIPPHRGDNMQVGDLVWSLEFSLHNEVVERRLAIIIALDHDDYNPYFIGLVACGTQGKTSRRYLEPMGRE